MLLPSRLIPHDEYNSMMPVAVCIDVDAAEFSRGDPTIEAKCVVRSFAATSFQTGGYGEYPVITHISKAKQQLMAGRASSTPCKFYAQGNCRFGASCRFSHDSQGARGGRGGFSGSGGSGSARNPFGGGGGSSGFGGGSGGFGGGNGGFGGGNGGFGGGSGANPFGGAAAAGVAMTDASRKLAVDELQQPPLWPLSGFAVAKGVRAARLWGEKAAD